MTVDYKKKYLKYKTKYVEAKKQKKEKNQKKILGGDLNIETELNQIMGEMKINVEKFESFVKNSNENILVIVYAHWCNHCVNMIRNIGSHLKSDVNRERIKYLDGTKLTKELKEKLEVRGFPTILKISNSNSIDNLNKKHYGGQREVAQMIEFLNE
jgi:thioredoxin-like negative regulator of GroEL